ncbi:ABC transporter F family member 4 [Picochlorum sp. SENEW3]|nr:ABC transporter F family member 4 [Picochlorum sp. SENEW3]
MAVAEDKKKKKKSSKSSKDAENGDLKVKKEKKEKKREEKKAPPKPEAQQKQKPKPKPRRTIQTFDDDSNKKKSSYLGDIDLPSSDSEGSDEEQEVERHVDQHKEVFLARSTAKESKKLADKERKMMEKAAAAKADALRDDDNVFDVSYEQTGDGDSTLSATDIKVHNMTIRAKGKILLENTTLTIAAGRRYGLVGPNGKGKSTVMRMIARRQIPVPENLDVLLVEQEVVGTDDSALASVVAADVELMNLRKEEAELNEKLSGLELDDKAGDEEDEIGSRLNEIYERMNELGGASAEARASKILHGLGFNEEMQKRSTNLFSGGWRMRISLARALYIQPTVLLLDEPTNHLDLRAVLWLEEYLTRWKKTLVVVSHDRDFLNSITTDIIHLHDEKLHYYRGNFAQFEEMYEQKRREMNKEYEKYQKQLRAAKKSGSKDKTDKVAKDAKQKAKQKGKKGHQGPAENEASAAPRQWNDYTVKFEFPEPTELTPPLLQLMDASFKYPGREDFGLKDLNIGIDMGSRVAIVGPNGAGKTTLMNLLAGDLEPTDGDQRKSHKLRIGRYNQHFVDALAFDVSPVEYLQGISGLRPEEIRAKLGKFGLSGHHHLQPICKLSGGQKARVVFAAIALSNPHILLLDEPTNHLDMQSIDALADALEEFEGGVVIISHDSKLLSRVCDDAERSEVWIVEDGQVAEYDGYFEDYKDELIAEIAADLDEEEREAEERKAAGQMK